VVAVPEFGGDKNFFPRDSAVTDRLAYIFFIAVVARGIDMAVTDFKGR